MNPFLSSKRPSCTDVNLNLLAGLGHKSWFLIHLIPYEELDQFWKMTIRCDLARLGVLLQIIKKLLGQHLIANNRGRHSDSSYTWHGSRYLRNHLSSMRSAFPLFWQKGLTANITSQEILAGRVQEKNLFYYAPPLWNILPLEVRSAPPPFSGLKT